MLKNVLFILYLISWYTCTNLYEDQVGRFDWHKKFIGTPTSLHSINTGAELLLQTDLNYISLISSQNSSIIWRFESQSEEIIVGIAEQHQLFLTSAQKSRSHVYAYSLNTGELLWEQTTPLNSGALSVHLDYPNIYHIQNHQTLSKGSITGTKWNWVFNLNQNQGSILQAVHGSQGDDGVVQLFTQFENELQLYNIQDKGNHYEISNSNALFKFKDHSRTESCVYHDSKDNSDIIIFKNNNEILLTTFNTQSPKVNIINHNEELSSLHLACSPFYSKHSSRELLENILLSKEGSDGTIQLVSLNLDSNNHKLQIKDQLFLSSQSSFIIENGSIITSPEDHSISLQNYGKVEKIIPITSQKMLTITKDGSVHMVSQSSNNGWTIDWSRDESLSKAQETIFLEFPVQNEKLVNSENIILDNQNTLSVFAAYTHRLKWHYNQLKKALFSFLGSPINTIIHFHPNLLISGTHKLLVFVNNDGKVAALNSQNEGEKVWDRFLNLSGRKTKLESAHVLSFPVASRNSLSHYGAPILVLRYISGGDNHELHVLDGWTGELINSKYSDFLLPSGLSIVDIKYLPHHHPKYHCKLLGLIDSESNVHVYPSISDQSIKELFDSNLNNQLYYYKIGETSLNGYKIDWSHDSKRLASKFLWEIKLPKGFKVYKSETNSGIDQMASPGKSVGDRSVLYKYLNPNLTSVMIQPINGTGMNLMLIDAVDGSTIHQASHQDAELTNAYSAHKILYENVLIYSYNSNNEIKFVVSELYEPNNEPSYDISSINRHNPKILTSAFAFTHSVTSMGFTKTNMGITSKEIIVSLVSNQIQAIPKSILDPRRPIGKLSSFDQEEGLTVYNPALPVLGKSLFSYYLDVANIRTIQSHPSEYESTTLILANGQDIYFTLRHPSNLFDVLSEDFSKISLIATLLGLTAGIIIVKPLIKSKVLKGRWA